MMSHGQILHKKYFSQNFYFIFIPTDRPKFSDKKSVIQLIKKKPPNVDIKPVQGIVSHQNSQIM